MKQQNRKMKDGHTLMSASKKTKHTETGREGLEASGGSRFGMELSPLKSGLRQPSADSNWS